MAVKSASTQYMNRKPGVPISWTHLFGAPPSPVAASDEGEDEGAFGADVDARASAAASAASAPAPPCCTDASAPRHRSNSSSLSTPSTKSRRPAAAGSSSARKGRSSRRLSVAAPTRSRLSEPITYDVTKTATKER